MTCASAQPNCTACTSSSTCTACDTTSGYYLSGNLCKECTCPNGYTRSNTTCNRTYAATGNSGNYTCSGVSEGGTLSGSQCYQTTSYSFYSCASYYCPSGGSLSGTTCTTSSSYAASCTSNKATICTASGCSWSTDDVNVLYHLIASDCSTCPTYTTGFGLGECTAEAKRRWGSTVQMDIYEIARPSHSPAYLACSREEYYLPSGSVCSCPNGGTLSGSTCYTSSNYSASCQTYNYICPSGWSGGGSSATCYRYVAANMVYSCPSGGTLSGTTCYQSQSATCHD